MKKQSFLKSSAILLSMVVITKILGLMFKIPLTHILGGTGMGYFSAAFSVFTPVFAIVVSGIPSSMARLAAENYALGRFANLRRQKIAAHITFGLMSFAACGFIILLSGPLSEYIIKESSAKYALVCVAPSVVFCTAMSVERGYYEGLRNMLPTALSEIAETIFKLVLGLGLAVFTADRAKMSYSVCGEVFGIACGSAQEAGDAALPFIAAAAILGSSLASGLACLALMIGTKIKGDGITKAMLNSDKVMDSYAHHRRILLKCAMPIAFAAVITTMTGMIDMLTINPCIRYAMSRDTAPFGKFLDFGISAEELPNFLYGSYEGLASLVYGLVPTLTAMFGKSALPSLADSWARGDRQTFSAGLRNMMTVSSVIAIPSGLGICALSEPLLRFLFDGRNAEICAAVQPLRILGISAVFLSISLPCFTVLQTLGDPKKIIAVMIGGGAVKLTLNILLVSQPQLGLAGAAYAELASSAFVCILSVIFIYRMGNVRCHVTETYIKPLYAGVMCMLSAGLSENFLNSSGLFNLNHRIVTIVSVAIGGSLYFISLYLLCETPKKLILSCFAKKNPKTT